MVRRVLALLFCAVALASCRVDVSVDLLVEPDGTGSVAVVATADADVVAVVPTIAEELATADIVAAGWSVDGPSPTPDGGLTITLTHDFSTTQEATNLLNSLGPPFNQMELQRNSSGDDTTTQVTGLLGLSDGFESFADEDLIGAVGSLPFAEEIAASGETPASSMSAVIRADLPGQLDEDQTNGNVVDDGGVEWNVPLDGTILEMRGVATQAPGDDRWWARPLSIIALVLLIAWVTFMIVFIGYVAIARWRRARRYRHRGSSGAPPTVGS